MTDGEWVWDLGWSDYIRAYRVAPTAEFRDYARSRNYVPVEISEERALAIVSLLGM